MQHTASTGLLARACWSPYMRSYSRENWTRRVCDPSDNALKSHLPTISRERNTILSPRIRAHSAECDIHRQLSNCLAAIVSLSLVKFRYDLLARITPVVRRDSKHEIESVCRTCAAAGPHLVSTTACPLSAALYLLKQNALRLGMHV